jgi:hypothetical protein
VPSVDDQKAVEEFAADGACEAFGDRVRSWRARRCLDDLDVGGGECAVAVADEDRRRRWALSRSMSRLRACWVSQARSVAGTTSAVLAPVRGLHLHRRTHGDNVLNALPDAITGNRWKSPLAC